MIKQLTRIYAIVLASLILWAWYTEFRFFDSTAEHLLPIISLSIVSLPVSLTLDPLISHWPEFFMKPYMQLSYLTFCAVFQVAVVLSVANFIFNDKVKK